MIRVEKHMELQTSVINIASIILKNLLKSPKMEYNKLHKNVCSETSEDAKINFDLALSFLFLIGKLDYDRKNDILELII